jgi:hypothetical protein
VIGARMIEPRLIDPAGQSSSTPVTSEGKGTGDAVPVRLLETQARWHLETADSVQLVGAVELVITNTDRAVQTHVIRGSESVSSELPGNLAVAAGRLLQTLASASLARASQ